MASRGEIKVHMHTHIDYLVRPEAGEYETRKQGQPPRHTCIFGEQLRFPSHGSILADWLAPSDLTKGRVGARNV